ncbi:uncharacterized protein LOC119175989 [Rhipicephalus microplus]|uniref:uncharacterized protein LOC119175989 n=1 Tax=Rhipicephalus microplus TaxID=6941 RepID=UPI003F6B9AA4
MSVGFSSKPSSCMHANILLLAAFFCHTVQSFKPDPAHYNTPHEAIEYIAWKALKEGKPPCVTVHPIGISLFCIMGQCVQGENGSSYCQCSQHFTGLTCSVYKGKCTSESICGPHLCQDNPNKISLYECVCKPGYHVPESPAFSHCVPDSILSSAIEEMYSESSTNTTTQPSTATYIEKLDKASMLLNISVKNTRTSLMPVTIESNASKPAVVCESLGFDIHPAQKKEENTAVDAFTAALQNTTGQDEPAESTGVMETNSDGTVLENQLHHGADSAFTAALQNTTGQDEPAESAGVMETNSHGTVHENQLHHGADSIKGQYQTKERIEENLTKYHVGFGSGTVTVALSNNRGVYKTKEKTERNATILRVGLNSPPVTAVLLDYSEALLSVPQQLMKRAVKVQVPVIQRRCASTFQSKQDRTFETRLTLDDLMPYQGDIEQAVDNKKHKKKEHLINVFKFKHHIPISSHLGNQVTQFEHADSSTTVPVQPFQKKYLNKNDDDYEVIQFKKRLLKMAPAKLFRNEDNSDKLLHRPAAYLVAKETKKMKAIKSYLKHKQQSIEAQDDIIDSLKHAVEVDEYSKMNVTRKYGHDSESTESFMVPEKRKRRESSFLQESKAVDNAITEQKQLSVDSVLTSERKNEPFRLMRQHKPVWPEHFPRKSHLQEAAYKPDENYEKKIGNLQEHSVTPVIIRKKNTPSQNSDRITRIATDAISWSNDKLKDSPVLLDAATKWKHEIEPHVFTSTPKNQMLTPCNNSLLLLSDVKVNTFLAHKKEKRHFTGRNPLLFFNVTVLNNYGSNKSSASYLVPLAGSKAIMISWGTYGDYSS